VRSPWIIHCAVFTHADPRLPCLAGVDIWGTGVASEGEKGLACQGVASTPACIHLTSHTGNKHSTLQRPLRLPRGRETRESKEVEESEGGGGDSENGARRRAEQGGKEGEKKAGKEQKRRKVMLGRRKRRSCWTSSMCHREGRW
jgi:hypothetical protein